MTIKYPGGIVPPKTNLTEEEKKNHSLARSKSAANRGMAFESDINLTNQYYRDKDLAIITKRPTPINIVKVDYTKGPKIVNAYFEKQSTTDYNGVYKGHYIDFEAKSSHSKTSFPLNNIAPQQVEHLEKVLAHRGIAFFLISFITLKKVYFLHAKDICSFYRNHSRSSIPLAYIEEKGHLVKEGYNPPYDYLPLIDEVFLKNEQ